MNILLKKLIDRKKIFDVVFGEADGFNEKNALFLGVLSILHVGVFFLVMSQFTKIITRAAIFNCLYFHFSSIKNAAREMHLLLLGF